MIISLFESIIVTFVFLGNSSLGLVVFFHNKKAPKNKYFLGLSLSLSFWVLVAYLSEFFPLKNVQLSLFLSKLSFVFAIFMVLFLYFFSFSFNEKNKKTHFLIKTKRYFFIIVLFFAVLVVFTNIIVESLKVYQDGRFDIVYGSLFYYLFLPFCFLLLFLTFFNFFSGYKRLNRVGRLQFQYFLIGLIIFLIISFFSNLVLRIITGSDVYYRIGNYSTIIFLGLTAYSIIRKNLFGVKIVLVEVLVFFIGIFLLIQVLISQKLSVKVFNLAIFLLFCFFGYLLIRSVLREIKLKEQLEAANKELKRLDEAKTEFLSIASHQLRTPLTAIKGYLGMIEEGIYGEVVDKVKEILHKVNDSNERLIRLVNSLLDISRLELGRMEFDFERVDIEEMLENIVDEFHIAARKKGLKLVFEHPKEKLPEITIDALKMRQVFLNLVDNAIKYTYEGEIIVKAELKDHGNERIRVSVSDTGMGIARNEINQIFKIYRRGTGVRLFPEGSGVGLYVAKKIVEAHNGKIWVKSQGKGRGSTFYVEMPLKAKKPKHL